MQKLGDEVGGGEELEALAEEGVVASVEEYFPALLLEENLAQGDRRACHVLRETFHGRGVGGVKYDRAVEAEVGVTST